MHGKLLGYYLALQDTKAGFRLTSGAARPLDRSGRARPMRTIGKGE
jgi:hypothetical protein